MVRPYITPGIRWLKKMRFKPTAVSISNLGVGAILMISLPLMYAKDFERLVGRFKAGNEYELKQVQKKRSLNSNAYLWVLCDEIAKVIHSTKEDVYRILIARKGWFVELQFANTEVMDAFRQNWQQNGTGFVTRTVDKDLCIMHCYYGSSRYPQDKMNALLDEAVQEAKALGIETLTPEELSRMKEEWGK